MKTANETHHSRAKESPLGGYLDILIMHATTQKKGLIEKVYNRSISISYKHLMELLTTLGNNLLTHYNPIKIVCPLTLNYNVFTTAAIDNIDHNLSSIKASGSFHTASSVCQCFSHFKLQKSAQDT